MKIGIYKKIYCLYFRNFSIADCLYFLYDMNASFNKFNDDYNFFSLSESSSVILVSGTLSAHMACVQLPNILPTSFPSFVFSNDGYLAKRTSCGAFYLFCDQS